MKIEFNVEGRPPRKSGAKSCWASDEANYVLEFRLKALEAKKNSGLSEPMIEPVKLTLEIYSPNVIDRSNSQTYLGDLDTFVAGVCESLQPADFQVTPNIIFKDHEDVHPNLPLILKDDAQVVEVIAKKTSDDHEHYSLIIETMDN